jgi:hypothetical protein
MWLWLHDGLCSYSRNVDREKPVVVRSASMVWPQCGPASAQCWVPDAPRAPVLLNGLRNVSETAVCNLSESSAR